MKRFYFSVFAMMIMALVCVGFASCGSDGDDDDNGSKPNGSSIVGNWYMLIRDDQEFINAGFATKFPDIKARMLEWIDEALQRHPQFTRSDFFTSNGELGYTYKWHNDFFNTDMEEFLGLNQYGYYLHIIDNNTLSICAGEGSYAYAIGSSGTTGRDLVAIINTGTVVGEVGWYALPPKYYTYELIDNKIYVPLAGVIYTISGTRLFAEGNPFPLEKFTPGLKY